MLQKLVLFSIALLALAIVLAGVWSCDKDGTSCPSNWNFSGIARTDDEGKILEDDPEDWQPRCARPLPEGVYLATCPAYPNPAADACAINYQVKGSCTITISIYDRSCRVVRSMESRATVGDNQIIWDLQDSKGRKVPKGIYRAEAVTVVDAESHKSWGDIEVIG